MRKQGKTYDKELIQKKNKEKKKSIQKRKNRLDKQRLRSQ